MKTFFLFQFKQGSSESKNSEGQRERISILLSCAICKEKSYNPITLHCLHSLCKECFEGNIREQLPDVCDLNSDVLFFCPISHLVTYLVICKETLGHILLPLKP